MNNNNWLSTATQFQQMGCGIVGCGVIIFLVIVLLFFFL